MSAAGKDLPSEGPGRRRGQAAVRMLKPAVVRGWRRELSRRAVDQTADAAGRSCLVLAPHPDDETLGAGALIARKRAAGTRVRVLVVTDGRGSHDSQVLSPSVLADVRRAESRQACAALGVPEDDLVHLDLHEGSIATAIGDVTAAVVAEVQRWEPDDLLVTSMLDWHEDHRALARVARSALAEAPGPRLLEYPVWCWADGPWSARPGRSWWAAAQALVLEPLVTARSARPVAVRTEPQYLAAKRAALDAYESQTTNLTGEPGWAVMSEAFLAAFLRPEELFMTGQPDTPTTRMRSAP